jgi:hypothetical protein
LKREAAILGALVGVALLAWGGFELIRARQCQGYEEDYLNAVGSLKGNAMVGLAISDPKLSESLKTIQELELKRIEITLTRIYNECGQRAGQTAARKATELMF